MKNTNRIFFVALFAALSSAGLLAQPPAGTPAGSQATGTTNSGGVAPADGKPATTPTGPTSGGTGSGTTPPTPATGTTTTTTTGNTTTPPGKSGGKGPNENASDTAKAVHEVINTFQASRDTYLADCRKLLDDLKKATTEAERQKILEELRQDKADREADERNLGKQIREELKKLREARKSGG